jgi:hypothetical protein
MLLSSGYRNSAPCEGKECVPETVLSIVGMRSVSSMRQRVTAVAAANRHTVVLAEGGTVYSWGSNLQGQLGYGTSDSASNAVPRIVEAMKARPCAYLLLC